MIIPLSIVSIHISYCSDKSKYSSTVVIINNFDWASRQAQLCPIVLENQSTLSFSLYLSLEQYPSLSPCWWHHECMHKA